MKSLHVTTEKDYIIISISEGLIIESSFKIKGVQKTNELLDSLKRSAESVRRFPQEIIINESEE